MVCMRVALHENDGNRGNDEHDEDSSESHKQGAECWIGGHHRNDGNDENLSGSHRSTHIASDSASLALASQAKPQQESELQTFRSHRSKLSNTQTFCIAGFSQGFSKTKTTGIRGANHRFPKRATPVSEAQKKLESVPYTSSGRSALSELQTHNRICTAPFE